MNRKRGKALTGEFRNEVLHFGKLITKTDGLIFFSAKIGSEVSPQCIAVVLDEFSKEKERELTVGSYAQKINTLGEEYAFISPVLELGMAPDDKPFFISEDVQGLSLDSFKFIERNELSEFFKKFRDVFVKLEEAGIDVSYIDSRAIYVESKHPLLFPAVRCLIGEEISENLLGLSSQKKSYRVFKNILANSLYLNSEIFPDSEILEAQLMDLAEQELEEFIDSLQYLAPLSDQIEAPDLNSYDEMEDFRGGSAFSMGAPTVEIPREEEHFQEEFQAKPFVEVQEDKKLSGGARALQITKKVWARIKPILAKVLMQILRFLWALPPKFKIGLGIALLIFSLIFFGGNKKEIDKVEENKESQSTERREASVADEKNFHVRDEKVDETEKEEESQVETPKHSPVAEEVKSDEEEVKDDSNENAEKEINAPRDKAEGMRSQQTIDDLDAIQSIQGPLKENQIKVLVQLTKTQDFEVRIASIRTLGEKAPKGNDQVKASLIDSLGDQDYLVRGFAVSSLTAYLEADSVPILEAHREKEENEIVVAAIDRAIKRLETYNKRR